MPVRTETLETEVGEPQTVNTGSEVITDTPATQGSSRGGRCISACHLRHQVRQYCKDATFTSEHDLCKMGNLMRQSDGRSENQSKDWSRKVSERRGVPIAAQCGSDHGSVQMSAGAVWHISHRQRPLLPSGDGLSA